MPDRLESAPSGGAKDAARAALAALEANPSRADIERAIMAAHRCLTGDGNAEETGDAEALRLSIAIADALSGLGTLAPGTAVWRQLRGQSAVRLYDLTGELPWLLAGVADLRAALANMAGADEASRAAATDGLAVALTRLGEQTSDVDPLHEALALLDARLPFAASDHRLANARGVAMMRIGAMAGDTTLVELAARDLQAFVRATAPTGAAADACDRNIAAILLENARQERSERVYGQVIRAIRPRVPEVLRSVPDFHYAQFLGSALLEVGRIRLETDLQHSDEVREAVALIERLVDATRDRPRTNIEALHQLGQARFLLGLATGDRAMMESAMTALREALGRCELDPSLSDGRRPRLRNDLANYALAYARRFDAPEARDEAEQLFEAALADLARDRAPGLRARMATGLFDLLYREKQWARAAAVADEIDVALARAESDPRLSAGVRLQGARLRSAVTNKHVTCLCKLGRVLDAAIILERARGRRIAIALGDGADGAPSDAEQGTPAIAAAEAALRSALAGDDDTACRLAWERLALARRGAELDLGNRDDALGALRHAALPGAAFVQLHFSDQGSHALLWRPGDPVPDMIALPSEAFEAIGALFHGEEGWIAVYERMLAGGAESEAVWNRAIETCQALLGTLIFAPIDSHLARVTPAAPLCVYLCPPGDLALLPLASARLPAGDEASERWHVSIVPNARILLGETRTAGPLLCVGGWTHGSDSLPELPMATLETKLLGERVPGVTTLAEARATPAAIVPAMQSAGVVHIACHAVYELQEPGRSGIELPGSRLTLSRLAASAFDRLPTRLVYLSCCEAGMTGRTRDVDEFTGLPGAFLQLGAQGVIASLWAVDDLAAMVFALAFYDRWQPGVPPAQALAATRHFMRTASWADLDRAGYLPEPILDRVRAGQLRTGLRRIGQKSEDAAQPHGAQAALPFAAPMHWAGWTLFGR